MGKSSDSSGYFQWSQFKRNLMVVNAFGIESWSSKSGQHTTIVGLPFLVGAGLLLNRMGFSDFRIALVLLAVGIVVLHLFLKRWARKARKKYRVTLKEQVNDLSKVYTIYLFIYLGTGAVAVGLEYLVLNVFFT